jgi:hypothetical protein
VFGERRKSLHRLHTDLRSEPIGTQRNAGQRRAPSICRRNRWTNNLRGQFFTDYNLLAAGSVIVALPTLVVFLLLQRHFIAGLTLGSSKG